MSCFREEIFKSGCVWEGDKQNEGDRGRIKKLRPKKAEILKNCQKKAMVAPKDMDYLITNTNF